jgi:hypothetical protein
MRQHRHESDICGKIDKNINQKITYSSLILSLSQSRKVGQAQEYHKVAIK